MIETIDIIPILIAKQLLLDHNCNNCCSNCTDIKYNTCLEWRDNHE